MNNFKRTIKVDNDTMEKVNAVEKIYNQQSRKMEFTDKIALAVYTAISEVYTQNEYEEKMQTEYLYSINRFLSNYEKLNPIIEQALENKRIKNR